MPTCDRPKKRERQRSLSTVGEHSAPMPRHIRSARYSTATQTVYLRRARHSSAARFVSALLQTGSTRINCTKCLIRRCRALQRAKELRNTGMLRLRKLTHMCSRTVSDLANRFLERHGRKILCRTPPVSKQSHVGNLRQIRKQGKGRSPKRKGTHLIRARRGNNV